MYIINLPFGRKRYVCETCGYVSLHEDGARRHEAVGVTETTELKVGSRVELYHKVWLGERYIGLSEDKETWIVEGIFYSEPGQVCLSSANPREELPLHTLCVNLAQRPREGSYVGYMLTYRDFQLWQEGDRAKLLAAGLIKKPMPEAPLYKRMLEKVLS